MTASENSLFQSAKEAEVAPALPLDQLATQALLRDPDQPAIEYRRRWFNVGDLRHVVDRMSAAIKASGARPDAAIAFIPRNRPSAIAALLGLIAQRRYVRMIYAFQSPAAIAKDVERLTPGLVVAAAEDFSMEVLQMLRFRNIAAIALTEMDAFALSGFDQASPDALSGYETVDILTSGTTGPPKHFAVGYPVIAGLVGAETDLSQATPSLLYFPLGNISGVFSTVPPLLKRQRVVLLDRFNVADWHDYVGRFRPASGSLPPSGVQMVLDAGVLREDLASLKFVASGAAPLDPTVQRAFEQHYGIPILLSYGATEFGGPVTAMTAELHAQWGETKFGSVGRPLPGVRLRVVDSESSQELAPGREGVLEVVSPRVGPQWIRTSDLVMIDEDGFLFHRGRNDGAIMRGGFKLLPETIERALMLHPAISAAAATGVPDTRLGQVPGVAMELKPGMPPLSVAELEAHLREQLPATHIPVYWRFVDALPRTASFKVDRAALRKLF